MRAKSLILLVLALGCGLVASIGITQVMAKRNATKPTEVGETQPVFVALKDIRLGDPLNSQVLKLEDWPKDKVPEGAMSRMEDLEGRRTRTNLYAGEPILENKLFDKGASGRNASPLIPKGYRVVAVKVDSQSGVGSLIMPGDRVDVLVHLRQNPASGINETSTQTILQDIKVFAVNDQFTVDESGSDEKSMSAKTISLMVTPEQAESVTLASELGKLRLVMRSPDDDVQTTPGGATPTSIIGATDGAVRENEQLVEPTPESKGPSVPQGFMDLVRSMQKKPEAEHTAPTDEPDSAEAPCPYTVRILRGTEPAEVVVIDPEGDTSSKASSGPQSWERSGSDFDSGTPDRDSSADEETTQEEPREKEDEVDDS